MLFLILILVQLALWSFSKPLVFLLANIPACRLQDQLRVNSAQHKSKATTKKQRKVIRGLKKRKDDHNKQTEGVSYGLGQFWTVQFMETVFKSWKNQFRNFKPVFSQFWILWNYRHSNKDNFPGFYSILLIFGVRDLSIFLHSMN